MQPEVVEQLKNLLPTTLQSEAWIAGGYAHDPEKAEDIDLWVVGENNLDDVEFIIRSHLVLKGMLSRHSPLQRELELSELSDELYDSGDDFRVVANVGVKLPTGGMKAVQVIVTRQPDIDSLLERFDITTHRIAYSLLQPQMFKVGEGYFPMGQQPRVKVFDRPAQRLKRIQRIAQRYGFEPHPEDVAQLEALLSGKEAKVAA